MKTVEIEKNDSKVHVEKTRDWKSDPWNDDDQSEADWDWEMHHEEYDD